MVLRPDKYSQFAFWNNNLHKTKGNIFDRFLIAVSGHIKKTGQFQNFDRKQLLRLLGENKRYLFEFDLNYYTNLKD